MRCYRQTHITALTLIVLLLAGCSGHGTQAIPAPAGAPSASPASVSVPFPDDRAASGLTEYVLMGNAPDVRSAGAVDVGTAIQLNSATAGHEYALYRFNPGLNEPDSISVLLEEAATTGAFVGLANYATGRWEFDGPYTKQKSFVIDTGDHVSPLGNIWVAVFAAQGQDATVNALSIRTINPANVPPTAVLVPNILAGVPPLKVALDGGNSADSDGQIIEYAWDWEGDGIYDGFSDGPDVIHDFTEPGHYNVTLRVTDDQFARATDSVLVDAGNAPPVARLKASPAASGNPGTNITLDATDSYDWDGGTAAFDYDLDGDGAYETPGITGPIQPAALPLSPGVQLVGVRVTDNEGATATATLLLTAQGWGGPPGDGIVPVSNFSSLAIVDGRPAIAYALNVENPGVMDGGTLLYIRAVDATGSAWDDPQTLDQTGEIFDLSMQVVGGRPAIAYSMDIDNSYFNDDFDVRYIRAGDTAGEEWNTPLTVDGTTSQFLGFSCSLAVVADRPAVAYQDAAVNHLRFVRAGNSTGSSWGPSLAVDSAAATGNGISLVVVSGQPCIACYAQPPDVLRFSYSPTPDGSLWVPAIDLAVGDEGRDPSLADVAGRPAVAYHDDNLQRLMFLRANDAAGSSWPATGLELDNNGYTGIHPSLAIIGGCPAISYCLDAPDYDLRYIAAPGDPTGAVWGAPETVDSGDATGYWSTLIDFGGRPAVSFYNMTYGYVKYMQLY